MRGHVYVQLACIALTWCGVAHGAASDRVIISLDVPPEKAPGWVCVITPFRSCENGAFDKTHKLVNEQLCQTREILPHLALDPVREDTPQITTYALTGLDDARSSPAALAAVAENLVMRRPTKDCEKQHGLCRPLLRLPKELATNGRITCGGNGLSPHVAILHVTFNPNDGATPGVKEIQVTGTTASLIFRKEFTTERSVVVQVIGGDYAPSSASVLGNSESAFVPLHPRCTRVIAEVPGYKDPIASVAIGSDSDPLHTGTCDATQRERTLALELPYTSTQERKTLRITYGSKPETVAETSWTSALPPVPLRLGIRSFRFTWRRPSGCTAESWGGDPDEPPLPRGANWSVACPRATLRDGSTCRLLDTSADEVCEYWCAVDPDLASESLPVPVHFERLRMREQPDGTASPSLIYSWDDKVSFSGQELASVVAPENRRVMLEYENRHAWADDHGEKIDEIRLVTHSGVADQLVLKGRPSGTPPPRWTALAAPGVCIDSMQLAIFGTRPYDQGTVPVIGNRALLKEPLEYRSRAHFHMLAGIGEQYEEFPAGGQPFVDLALGLSYDLRGPWTINLAVSAQLTRTSYETIEFSPGSSTYENVPYLRFDARLGLEYWWYRRLHVFGALGGGLSTPLQISDDARVGFVRKSAPVEVGGIVTLAPRRIWLILLMGVRMGEEHIRYRTDFLGEPTTDRIRQYQPYFAARFRWRIG